MRLAIAVEATKHPKNQDSYQLWYLKFTRTAGKLRLTGLGRMSKDELIQDIFKRIKQSGKTNWWSFPRGAEKPRPIELLDFIGKNIFENTHFGNLPSLNEFQGVLKQLELKIEAKITA